MLRNILFAIAVPLLLVAHSAALASPTSCRDAIESYNTALGDIATTLKKYSNCVSNSEGRDDCSPEFRRLKSAQSDFELAVSSFGLECH